MELLFESRPEVTGTTGKVRFFQRKPDVHPEPVLERSRDAFVDGAGATIYGTVLRDGGMFRMWYQGWPKNWNGNNVDFACYAESNDGIEWRKPKLGLVDYGGTDNNLVNLKGHPPCLFIDPDAPASHRYRATMSTGPGHQGADPSLTKHGFYTAHSADGFHWEYDRNEPRWQLFGGDVINCAYNPARRQAMATMKCMQRFQSVTRRSFWTAEFQDGRWADAHMGLIPDDYDNIRAMSEGCVGADYYGWSMMPAGLGMVGFLWTFRHTLPTNVSTQSDFAWFGNVNVSLVYQNRSGDRWLHMPGRPDFIHHKDVPWENSGEDPGGGSGNIYTACAAVEVGDEQRLYITKTKRSHAWYIIGEAQQAQEAEAIRTMATEGFGSIGFVKWPKWRLFGFKSDPQGTLTLNIPLHEPCVLNLNYECGSNGSIRAELSGVEGRGLTDAVALTGNSLSAPVAWRNGTSIQPGKDRYQGLTEIVFHLDQASIYAYEIVPQSAERLKN